MTTTGRKRARKQPAEVRREEILDAAIRVFAGASYHAAGTADIARAVGVAEPTLYRHFGSKREIYLAALRRTATLITDAWRAIIAATPDAAAALDRIGHWYGQSIELAPDPLRLRHRAAAETEDEDVRDALRHGYLEVHGLAAEVIRRGQAQGVFAPDIDPIAAAWLFCGIGMVCDLALLTGMDKDPASGFCEEPGGKLGPKHIGALLYRALVTRST